MTPVPATDLAAADAADRLRALQDTADLLWNTTSRVVRRQRRDRVRLLVVPSAQRPRLAVPAGHRRVAATAVAMHGDATGTAARAKRRALAWLLRAGAGPLLRTGLEVDTPDSENLLAQLEILLGRQLWPSIALTPRRANRKPVVHLLDNAGHSVAFAKIGTTDLTRRLVRHEAQVLGTLAGADFRRLRPPTVLHAGPWRDVELLVLAPLPTGRATPATPTMLAYAMRELSALPPPAHSTDSTIIDYIEGFRVHSHQAGAALSADDRTVLTEIDEQVTRLGAVSDVAEIPTGWWHGDWAPWNCAEHAGRVLVWDWERATPGVPVGFDAAHHYIQTAAVHDHVSRFDAATRCLERAADLLGPWQLSARHARIVVALYLADIARRYLVDGQRAAGGAGGDVRTWAVPVLRSIAQGESEGNHVG